MINKISVFIILFSLAACGGSGLSKVLQNDVDSYLAQRDSTVKAISEWGVEMNSIYSEINNRMEASMSRAESATLTNEEEWNKLASVCGSIGDKMEMVERSYNQTLQGLEDDMQTLEAWKQKVLEESLSDEEALPVLNDLNVKLSAYQDNIGGWRNLATELNKQCIAICLRMDQLK